MSFRPRPAVGLVAIVVALGALTACTSTPSNRQVVNDQIEALQLPAAPEQCMFDVLATYSNDDLEALAEQNADIDFSQEGAVASATPEFQEYVERMGACVDGAESSTAGTTVASDSSDAAESTDAETTDATDAVESTDG